MKAYKDIGGAVRAASKALGVPRKKAEVLKVAMILETDEGWIWEPIPESVQEKPKPKASTSGKTWNRPKPGTKGARVWEIADTAGSRKEAIALAVKEGLVPGMVAQAYFHWSHRSKD